jgi:hypothetical protein
VDVWVILAFHLILQFSVMTIHLYLLFKSFMGFSLVLENLQLLDIKFVNFSSFFMPDCKILTFSHIVIFLAILSPLKNNFLQVFASSLFFSMSKYDVLNLTRLKINYFQWNEFSKNLQMNILLNFHHQ